MDDRTDPSGAHKRRYTDRGTPVATVPRAVEVLRSQNLDDAAAQIVAIADELARRSESELRHLSSNDGAEIGPKFHASSYALAASRLWSAVDALDAAGELDLGDLVVELVRELQRRRRQDGAEDPHWGDRERVRQDTPAQTEARFRAGEDGRQALLRVLQQIPAGEVAARCFVSSSAVSRWAAGTKRPSIAARHLLAVNCGIPVESWASRPASRAVNGNRASR